MLLQPNTTPVPPSQQLAATWKAANQRFNALYHNAASAPFEYVRQAKSDFEKYKAYYFTLQRQFVHHQYPKVVSYIKDSMTSMTNNTELIHAVIHVASQKVDGGAAYYTRVTISTIRSLNI